MSHAQSATADNWAQRTVELLLHLQCAPSLQLTGAPTLSLPLPLCSHDWLSCSVQLHMQLHAPYSLLLLGLSIDLGTLTAHDALFASMTKSRDYLHAGRPLHQFYSCCSTPQVCSITTLCRTHMHACTHAHAHITLQGTTWHVVLYHTGRLLA